MNMVAPPATFVTLFLFLPPFLLFKLFLSFLSSFFPENMSGKVVLITGASSAIGEQLAYQYAARGASLALVAKREDRLHEVADTAREVGAPDILVVPADVIRADECQRFMEITMNHFGRMGNTEAYARAVVDGACRGERCVTEPSWFRVMHLYRVFAPEVLDWCYRVLYVTKPGSDDLSKRILDAAGAKEYLCPASMQSPPLKSE